MIFSLHSGDKIALTALSDGFSDSAEIENTVNCFRSLGLDPACGTLLHGLDFDGKAKARELESFFFDDSVKAIFDISGGDTANELLPYLSLDGLPKTQKVFAGYSDLTVLLNAFLPYPTILPLLWQAKTMAWKCGEEQKKDFLSGELFRFPVRFLRGSELSGSVVGGNIRCFLKLAGTAFFPDLTDKILLLEAYGCTPEKMLTYLSQLRLLGAFEKVKGVLLGTFTQMEREGATPSAEELVLGFSGELPVAKTDKIGHGPDSKAILLGRNISLKA